MKSSNNPSNSPSIAKPHNLFFTGLFEIPSVPWGSNHSKLSPLGPRGLFPSFPCSYSQCGAQGLAVTWLNKQHVVIVCWHKFRANDGTSTSRGSTCPYPRAPYQIYSLVFPSAWAVKMFQNVLFARISSSPTRVRLKVPSLKAQNNVFRDTNNQKDICCLLEARSPLTCIRIK